jgi:hypothetical protein
VKIVGMVCGVISVSLGGLWLLQGLGIVRLRPILCFADCTAIDGPSLTWAIVGALALAAGVLTILWSLKWPQHVDRPESTGGTDRRR